MTQINLFGNGFVGGEFVKQFPDTVVNQRDSLIPQTPNILYTISTVDNYNVKENPFLDIQTNLIALMEILEAGRKKFGSDFSVAFCSSWFVYGFTDYPACEDSYCDPTGFYSITKRCAEQLLRSYAETFNVKFKILRLANVLGVSDKKVSKKKNYLQYAIRQLVNGETVTLYEGKLIRDFIDVRDAVRAIALIMEKGELNSIYNVGNGVPYSVEEIIYMIQPIVGNGAITRIPVPGFHKQVQVGDFYLDTTKLDALGFLPKHDIYDTVREIAEFYAS
jgi:nucleoside-diphosphate-sugar epimerase